MYLQFLRTGYAFRTIRAYFNDLKVLQQRWARGISLHVLHQTFDRCRLLLQVYAKDMPIRKELKRPWRPEYFHQVLRGMGWGPISGGTKGWGTFRQRSVWTVMVLMHEHLLRLGEVAAHTVPRQTMRRPWTHANVHFWVEERAVAWTEWGAPDPADRVACTHATLDPVPNKTDPLGEYGEFVCPCPSYRDIAAKEKDQGRARFDPRLLSAGTLLWDLMTRNPVPRVFASCTPLFRMTAVLPPKLAAPLTQTAWANELKKLCRDARPQIPLILDGKTLGGHCMRVAGCNFAKSLNATMLQLADKGRWARWSWVQAQGYDYLRSDYQSVQELTKAMVMGLAFLPPGGTSGAVTGTPRGSGA